jgi:hypothetical protein
MFNDIPKDILQFKIFDVSNIYNTSEITDILGVIFIITYSNFSYFFLYNIVERMTEFLKYMRLIFYSCKRQSEREKYEKIKLENTQAWYIIEREKRCNYDAEKRKKANHLSVQEFILRYILIPKNYRMKILTTLYNNLLKETLIDNEDLLKQQGFYILCKQLINVLSNYEKQYSNQENLYLLLREISFSITFCRCRVYDYLSKILLQEFHNKYQRKYKKDIEENILTIII